MRNHLKNCVLAAFLILFFPLSPAKGSVFTGGWTSYVEKRHFVLDEAARALTIGNDVFTYVVEDSGPSHLSLRARNEEGRENVYQFIRITPDIIVAVEPAHSTLLRDGISVLPPDTPITGAFRTIWDIHPEKVLNFDTAQGVSFGEKHSATLLPGKNGTEVLIGDKQYLATALTDELIMLCRVDAKTNSGNQPSDHDCERMKRIPAPSALAGAPLFGISGKWRIAGTSDAYIIHEETKTINYGIGELPYDIEDRTEDLLTIRQHVGSINSTSRTFAKPGKDVLVEERDNTYRLLLREGGRYHSPSSPVSGRWKQFWLHQSHTILDLDAKKALSGNARYDLVPVLHTDGGEYVSFGDFTYHIFPLTDEVLAVCLVEKAWDEPLSFSGITGYGCHAYIPFTETEASAP